MISREAAHARATEFLRTRHARGFALPLKVRGVFRHQEIRARRPAIYPAHWSWTDVWIAYVVVEERGLASSEVVILSNFGDVLYAGPANDEG